MKIGFDAKRLFRNYTGLGNYSRTLVGNLGRWAADDDYYLLSEREVRNDETEEFLDGRYNIITPARGRKTWRSWGCVKDIKRYKLDIYHGLSHDLPFGIAGSGARTVVTIHDVCYKTFPSMFPLVERLIYGVKYKYSLRHADRVIAISESTKRDVERFFPWVDPTKIEVIYQALNPVFYEPADVAEARRVVGQYGVHGDFVLYVGSINSRKNLMGVLQAYARVHSSARLPLVIIGNGSGAYFKSCFDAVEALELGDEVVHIENLSSMRVLRDFYTLARFMVYPSFYEGFGLPVAEAQLCGCPVITSTVSSLPEAGGHNALYVDPSDTEALTAAMGQLLSMSATEREQIGRRGREWVASRFDPKKLTAQVAELYHKLAR